jgi:cytidylate kinase
LEIAERVAKGRHQRVVYHETLGQLANRMRVRRSHVVRLLDGKAGKDEQLTSEKTSRALYTPEETFNLLRDEDVGVLRGWGAVPLLQDVAHVVKVRVCAPMKMRVRRMMERLDTDDHGFVENEIMVSDASQDAITRRHFGTDWRDASQYDLVLNTGELTIGECVDEIENVMEMSRVQRTTESVEVFDNLSLQWHVRAAMRRDPRTTTMELDVLANRGNVRLRGALPRGLLRTDAVEVAFSVEGVEKVTSEIEEA